MAVAFHTSPPLQKVGTREGYMQWVRDNDPVQQMLDRLRERVGEAAAKLYVHAALNGH